MLDEASLAQTAPRARFTTFEPCGHPPHSALRLSRSLTIRFFGAAHLFPGVVHVLRVFRPRMLVSDFLYEIAVLL